MTLRNIKIFLYQLSAATDRICSLQEEQQQLREQNELIRERSEKSVEVRRRSHGGAGRCKHAHVPYARTRACRLHAYVRHALRVYAPLAHASRMRVCIPDRLQAPGAAVTQAARNTQLPRLVPLRGPSSSRAAWTAAPGPLGLCAPNLRSRAGCCAMPPEPVGGPGCPAPAPTALRASLR